MTADLAGQVRALALTDALRRVAPEQIALADRISFCERLDGTDHTSPYFDDVVAAEVRAFAGPPPAERRAAQAAADAHRRATGQWTDADVEQASPAEVDAARVRGQLRNLGIAAPKREPRPLDGVRVPSGAQIRRWKQMPPWQAQRARAAWLREGREQGLQDGHQMPELPAGRDHSYDRRPLTTQEMLARAKRVSELSAPGYSGEITADDVRIAPAHLVEQWMNSGHLIGLGVPPRRRQRGY